MTADRKLLAGRAGNGWRAGRINILGLVCTENLIRVDEVAESPKLAQ
jgi:hypothetical protein